MLERFDNLVGTSVGNELCHEGLLIQWFHGLRLAQSRVTIAKGRWSMWHSQHSTRKSTEHHSVLHHVIRNCENLKLCDKLCHTCVKYFQLCVILAERNKTSSHLYSQLYHCHHHHGTYVGLVSSPDPTLS